jgi:hypothetical protein
MRQVFSELDASDLRFSVAPEPPKPGEGPWRLLEIGDAGAQQPPPSAGPKTMPFVSARDAGVAIEAPSPGGPRSAIARGPASSTEDAFAHTRLVPPPPPAQAPGAVGAVGAPNLPELGPVDGMPHDAAHHAPAPRIASLLEAFGDPNGPSLAMHPSGVLLARTGSQPGRAFAGRIDAVRVVSGVATPQALRRRVRDADTAEVLGGAASPLVRFDGNARIVLGARDDGQIVLLGLEDDLAFVREDRLLGFELSLAYENGKLALDAPGETGDASPIVQLRGTGGVALEIEGELATAPSAPDRPLLVRREWIVGWVGRLMPRAVGAAEAPNGQRGLVSFSGDGAVLVRIGG